MIYRPGELKFDNQRFSMIIYGPPGVGKTTLAASAEKPLLIDIDKGVQRVKAQHQPPYTRPNTYEQLLEDLASEDVKEFETIIIDTGGALITLLQDYVIRKDPVNRQKNGTISQKGFGAVKQEFSALTNKLKTVFNKNIIYVFHSIEEKNKDGNPIQRLLCEGSAKNIVWQPCDFGAFLYKNGDKTYAGFTPTDEYFAKACYGISGVREIPFGANVRNDFLTRLFAEAKANIAADGAYFEKEKERYARAMEAGKKLIEAVITPDHAAEFTTKVKALDHALTSLDELRTAFKEHLAAVGIEWNRDAKKYEYIKKADKPAEAEKTPEEPKKDVIDTISIEDVIEAEERKTRAKGTKEGSGDEQIGE